GEREVLARVGPGPEAVPGGDAVLSDAARRDLPLEHLEGGADAGQELLAGNAAELRLGVVHVIDVDGREAQVAEASPELVLEIARRHRVPAAHHVLGLEDAGAHVGVAHVLAGIDRHAAVEGDVPALGAHDHLLAREAALALEGDQGLADDALATLPAVVDGGVEQVAAGVDGVDDRLPVAAVDPVVLLAEIRSQADRAHGEAVEGAEVRPRQVSVRRAIGRGRSRRGARHQPAAATSTSQPSCVSRSRSDWHTPRSSSTTRMRMPLSAGSCGSSAAARPPSVHALAARRSVICVPGRYSRVVYCDPCAISVSWVTMRWMRLSAVWIESRRSPSTTKSSSEVTRATCASSRFRLLTITSSGLLISCASPIATSPRVASRS